MKTLPTLLTSGAFLAVVASASASTVLLQTDFTSYADLDAAKADGWAQTTRNGRNDPLGISATNGLESVGWKQSTLDKSLAGTVDLGSDLTYTINFRQLTSAQDSARHFALVSNAASLVIGGSYNSDPGLYVGTEVVNVLTSSDWYTFQGGSGNPQIAKGDTVSSTYLGSAWHNYEIVIEASSAGQDTMTVNITEDGGGAVVSDHVYQFASSDVYDGAGFMMESGATTAFSDLSITQVPEPSSAALLGLGGLAMIMRRRK